MISGVKAQWFCPLEMHATTSFKGGLLPVEYLPSVAFNLKTTHYCSLTFK